MGILLVEDDRKIGSFVVKGLKAAGYAVDHACDGEQGLEMALHAWRSLIFSPVQNLK